MSYIKLDRKITEWEWFDDSNVLRLWIYILANVNYENKKWHGEDVPKGSMITSLEHLSQGSMMSVRSVRTCLQKLSKTEEISVKTTSKFTQINVNKWALYQCRDVDSDKQTTNKRQTNDKQTTTTKEYILRNIRNKRIYNIPIYDTSINKNLTESELKELLEMREHDKN